jgi:hypothetical protein
MASKNAKRNAKNFMNGPFFVILLVIAVIVAIVKLIAG